jgi:eukaryotic-like serine/threonine-protein kinase
MGVVYLGFDPLLKRRVAVKTVRSSSMVSGEQPWDVLVHCLQREARATAGLNHPNIVGVYDVVPDGEAISIVMEFVDGKSLAETVPDGSRFSPKSTVEILRCCAAALDHAHARGVIHRDVKPGNIMIDAVGAAKVTDFGIAKLAGDSSTYLTRGYVLGTLEYMSPEQMDARPVNGRTQPGTISATPSCVFRAAAPATVRSSAPLASCLTLRGALARDQCPTPWHRCGYPRGSALGNG